MRATGRTARGVLVAAALLLAGCSGDGDDKPVTLPTTTASSTSVESTTPPPTNTPSSEPTPTTTLVLPDIHVESADLFVQEFFAALNGATETGDFSGFDSMYLPQCSGCVKYRAELQGWLANGQSVQGGRWTVLQQSSEEVLDGARILFRVIAYRAAASILSATGDIVETIPGTSALLGGGGLIPGEPWTVEDMSLSAQPGQ